MVFVESFLVLKNGCKDNHFYGDTEGKREKVDNKKLGCGERINLVKINEVLL